MRTLVLLAAAMALGAAISTAAAQSDDARQAALDRAAAPAPQAPFPDLQEAQMTEYCAPGQQPRYYPPEALQRRRGGNVVLDCALGEDGHATACYVLYEDPRRMQFADAALRIACRFRMATPNADGSASSDGNLPANSRVYRRDGDGEPWRARIPVIFRIGQR